MSGGLYAIVQFGKAENFVGDLLAVNAFVGFLCLNIT